MLYLNPPFHIIKGVSLLADHQDPLQFYYLPLTPRLAQLQKKVGNASVPQIQLIAYRGGAGTGGFLNFDVDLGVNSNKLEEIGKQLKNLKGLSHEPRLAPIPLIDGIVKMMLFGKQTGDIETGNQQHPRFVLKIDQAAHPALYGDNSASFSIALDQAGVSVLKKAMQGEMTPVGIVYSLQFLALRPAYNVSIHADWHRVKSILDEQFTYDSLVFSSDIEKAVNKLIDDRVVEIQADLYVTEEEDHQSISERYERAVTEVKDMVTNGFFEPAIYPRTKPEEPDSLENLTDTCQQISMFGLTGGASAFIGAFAYKKLDYTQIDERTLNANILEHTTVMRSIYPQGHLTGLCRVLKDGGGGFEDYIRSVDLDDPWFQHRKVKVIARADFEKDKIQSIHARLKYGDEQKDVLLEGSDERKTVQWNSIVNKDVMVRDVEVSYKVTFRKDRTAHCPPFMEPSCEILNMDNWEIDPRVHYSILTIPIYTYNVPWQRYPRVEVYVAYGDSEKDLAHESVFVLHKDKPQELWEVFQLSTKVGSFKYQIKYIAANHENRITPWVECLEPQIRVVDPMPDKEAKVTVLAQFDWAQIELVTVEISYIDEENKIEQRQTLHFIESDKTPKIFAFHPATNTAQKLVEYVTTVVFKDRRLIEIPRSVTNSSLIIISSDTKGHRMINVQPEPVPFSEKKVKNVKLELAYDDDENNIHSAQQFSFNTSEDNAVFEFDYMSSEKNHYRYRAAYLYKNGLTQTTDWIESDKTQLVVPLQ